MTPEEFRVFREKLQAECTQIIIAKGKDYSGEKDVLTNFKRCAERLGMENDVIKIWAVYFIKHLDAILAYVATGKVASESIRSRIIDAKNYLDFGLAIAEENEKV